MSNLLGKARRLGGLGILLACVAAVAAGGAGAAGVSAATVGRTAVGPLTHPLGGGYLEVSGPYMLSSSASLSKLTGYLQGGGSATAMRAVVYADTGSNQPGVFVVASSEVMIGAGAAAAWVDFPVVSSPTLAVGKYWLGLWELEYERDWLLRERGGAGRYAPARYSGSGSPPASWPGGGSSDSIGYSLYATLGVGPGVPSNTGLPVVSGTAVEGQQLTATDGAWDGSPTGFVRQWQRCGAGPVSCTDIGGETGSAYTLTSGDVGSVVRFSVVASNGGGSSLPAFSAPTGVVQGVGVPPGGVLGRATVGGLTHTLGGNYLEVSGRYSLSAAAPLNKLSAYLQGGGLATAIRAVVYADNNSSQPGAFVAASAQVTIAAGKPAGWVDFPVAGSPVLPVGTYWLGLWSSNTSAMGVYESAAGAGRYAPAVYSASASPPGSWPGGGSSDTLGYSVYATLGGAAGGVPTNTAAPTISGTATQGQQLTAAPGSWAGAPTGFAYQWQRCSVGPVGCADISGETNATYTLMPVDVNSVVRVSVIASNASGPSVPAVSDPTAVVQGPGFPPGSAFGKTSVGALTHTLGGNYLEVSGPYTIAGPVQLMKLVGYLRGGGAPTGMRTVVYADAASQPSTLVAVSQQVTISAGAPAAWFEFPVAGAPTLPAGTYWLGYWASNFSATGFYDTASGAGRYAPALYSPTNTPPGSWPGGGLPDTIRYSLYVPTGQPPTDITLSPTSVDENQPAGTLVGQLTTSDPDASDTHTYTLVNTVTCPGPDNASFQIGTGADADKLKTAASLDYEAPPSHTRTICVRTTDPTALTYDKQFTIQIGDVNEPPTDISLSPSSIAENQPVDTTVGTLSVTDQDVGQEHNFYFCSSPDTVNFTIHNLTVVTTAVFDYETKSSYTICIGTIDTPGLSFEKQFTINVTNVDDPPTAVNDTATVLEDATATAVDVLANDTDPDGGPKTIGSVTQPAHGTVVITGGGTGLTYQPNAGYCNNPPGTTPDTFTYTLSPGGSIGDVSVTVTCVDTPPTAVNDSQTVPEDATATALDVLTNDTDPDGGPKSIASVTQPAHGTVVITGGGSGLTYQPSALYCNNPPGTSLDTFTYTLSPGGSTATVSMTVPCVDHPPVAVNDSATVLEDAAATAVDVLTNDTDPDGGPKSIGSVTQPANGTVLITGGGTGLTYQPSADYCNSPPGTTPDTFTYTLSPGSSVGTVSVTVTCVNDAPSFTKGADVTGAHNDQAYSQAGWATAISPGPANENSQTVDFVIDNVSDTSLFTVQPAISPSGDLTFTPDSTKAGTATVTIHLHDDGGTANGGHDESPQQQFTIITVFPPPIAADDSYAATGNVKIDVSSTADGVLNNDTLRGGALSHCGSDNTTSVAVSSGTCTTSSASGGSVVLSTDGTFTYDPPAGFTGTDHFFYKLTNTAATRTPATSRSRSAT